ncbi:MAG: Uma2 family endonuclease [Gammaproteobacteria bacterium]|nr:Uma2 family endonuclease [Gammaproteobacteria bacterium]
MSAVAPQPYRFNVDEYHRMGEAGIFHEDQRVELINGEVVEMSPIGSPHVTNVNRLTRLFVLCLGNKGIVSVQNPVQLSAHTELQPDLALLKPRSDDYEKRLPISEDVFLVIEVADSSAQSDRKVKAPLYAGVGIPELWIVDIPNRALEVHTAPTDAGYGQLRNCGRGQRVTPAALPACTVSVDRIFAP